MNDYDLKAPLVLYRSLSGYTGVEQFVLSVVSDVTSGDDERSCFGLLSSCTVNQ
jgi:hypothetical protein